MADNKIRCAIIGYGGMGKWHERHMVDSDVVTLAGIYDIDPVQCDKAREKGIHVYASEDDVYADESVKLVVIATPNELHMPIAVRAMAHGKNVISEKPVTPCSEDLEKIIEASKKYGKLFTVHQNRRYDEDFLMMKKIYESGDLGEVFAIESRVQGSRGIPGDWRGKKEHGGGMMLDWGVHLIDQMLGIVTNQKIKKIYCTCDHITNYEVDDGFQLDLTFESGLRARIEVGTSHFISIPRYYMTGTNGSALIQKWHESAKIVCCKNWDEKDVLPVVTAAGLTKTMAPRNENTITEYEMPCPGSDVHDFYRNVVKAIRGEEEQDVTHIQVMRSMKIMEAAFESDRLGRPVDFEDFADGRK